MMLVCVLREKSEISVFYSFWRKQLNSELKERTINTEELLLSDILPIALGALHPSMLLGSGI